MRRSILGLAGAALALGTLLTAGAHDREVGSTQSDSAKARYEREIARLATREPLPAAPRMDVAFVNVNVLPMTHETVLRDRTVIVHDGRIEAIGRSDELVVRRGLRVVKGENGYLMPGLADMHVHAGGDPLSLGLLFANGVTTMREMSGRPGTLRWAGQVEAGEILGPSIYTTGPILGSRATTEDTVAVESPQEAAEEVERQYAAGFRMLKPYTFLSAESYGAAMKVARAKGMYVVGHVPYSVGVQGVMAGGQNELAHVHSLHQDYFLDFDPARVFERWPIDAQFIPARVPALKQAGLVLTTTLVVNQAFIDAQDLPAYLARPSQAYETVTARAYMDSEEWRYNKLWPRDYLESVYMPYLYRLTGALQKAGVPLVLGTDSGVTSIIHGFSTHEELVLLTRAGLTPYEALQAGTSTAARIAGAQSEWGTIEVGKRADLLLLRANPLEGIHHTREIAGVMQAGRWLERAALDALLLQIREAYQ